MIKDEIIFSNSDLLLVEMLSEVYSDSSFKEVNDLFAS